MAPSLAFLLLSSFLILFLSDGAWAPLSYNVREDSVLTDPLPFHLEGIDDNVIISESFHATHETEGPAGRSLAELDDYTPGANPSPSSTPPPVSL